MADAIPGVKTWSPLLGQVLCFHQESCLQTQQIVLLSPHVQHWDHLGLSTDCPPQLANSTLTIWFSWPWKTQRLKLWFHQKMRQALAALVGAPLPPLTNGHYSRFSMVVHAALRSLVLGFSRTWFCIGFPSPFNSQSLCGSEVLSGRLYLTREQE